MPTLEELARRVAVQPLVRYEHPSVVVSDALRNPGSARVHPALPGNQVFLRVNELVLLDDFDGCFNHQNEIRIVGITIDSNVSDPIQLHTPLPFPSVRKNSRLPLGDKGLGIYSSSESLPEYVCLQLVVMEDDSDIRDVPTMLGRIRASAEYGVILSAARTLAKEANPCYGTLVTIADSLVGLVSRTMEQSREDLVAYFAATYTLAFDNLGVGRHTFHADERARIQYEILARNSAP